MRSMGEEENEEGVRKRVKNEVYERKWGNGV
jgi:hypothetical protein